MRFDEKIVLITGASSGVGAALARQFAQEGAHLVLAARREERLIQQAQDLESLGGQVLPVVCDVTQDGALESVVEQSHQSLGALDVVVANAGFGVSGTVEQLSLNDYRRQLETNFFGAMRTVYATLDDLKQTRGRFVFVNSALGYAYLPAQSAYTVSKFALRAFSDTLRLELAPKGVSVSSIILGFVESEIRKVDNWGHYHPDAEDNAPSWLVMPAEKAARQILSAIHKRKPYQLVTLHARLLLGLSQLFPRFYSWGLSRFF